MEMRKWSRRLTELVTAGTSQEDALAVLRGEGASAVETIAALHDARGMSLAAAKQVFSKSEAWADVNASAEKLHDALERLARESSREK
jgi:hypothetical protein